MRYTTAEHLAALRLVFTQMWGASEDVLRCNLLHEVVDGLPDDVRPPDGTGAKLTKPPGVQLGGAGLKVRFPEVGRHQITLDLPDGWGAQASFALEVEIRGGSAPVKNVDVAVSVSYSASALAAILAAIAARALSPGTHPVEDFIKAVGAASLPLAIEKFVEETTRSQLAKSDLTKGLSGLGTMRYEPGGWALPPGASPVSMDPAGAAGTVMRPIDCQDIVFVADGYDSNELGDFDTTVDACRSTLLDPSRADNLPFRRVSGALRFWKFSLSGKKDAEQISAPVTTAGKAVMQLKNLARLAEVVLAIDETLDGLSERASTRPPLVIVVRRESVKAREISLGNVVLLRQHVGVGTDEVLIHELGHTIGRLADEYYPLSSLPQAVVNTVPNRRRYYGPEPEALNVSVNPAIFAKWRHLVGRGTPGTTHVLALGAQGGFDFDSGIVRPAARCKMNDTNDDFFCPVCEESIQTNALRRVGLGNRRIQAPVTVELDVQVGTATSPGRVTVPAPFRALSRARIPLDVAAGGGSVRFELKVIASAIEVDKISHQVDGNPWKDGPAVDASPGQLVVFRLHPPADLAVHPNLLPTIYQQVSVEVR